MTAIAYNKKDVPLPHANRRVIKVAGRISPGGVRLYDVQFADDPIPSQLVTSSDHERWFVIRGGRP